MASPVENSAKQLPDEPAQEPSMEEILASIKQIIADDEDGSAARAERENFSHPDNPSNSNEAITPADDDDTNSEETKLEGGASSTMELGRNIVEEPQGEGESQRPSEANSDADVQAALEAEMKFLVQPEIEAAVAAQVAASSKVEETLEEKVARVRSEVSSAATGLSADERLAKYRVRGQLQTEKLAAEIPAAPKPAASSAPVQPHGVSPHVAAAVAAGPVLPTTNAVAQEMAATMMKEKSGEIQQILTDLLRPTLRQWLSDNLPSLVEKLVREEIESVSKSRKVG